jgi:cardiolipin synthase
MDHFLVFWSYLWTLLELSLCISVTCHVILTKRDTRAATLWVGLIWLAPVVGTLLYVWLGINRIERHARSLRARHARCDATLPIGQCSSDMVNTQLGVHAAHLQALTTLTNKLTQRSLTYGNRVIPLVNGDQAFPAMLDAIDQAARSISLSTYIFDNDHTGEQFKSALQRAVQRKVEVRVLIDDMGARYSWPAMPGVLTRAGIPCARFIPPMIPTRLQFSNLRTHRKILVVDGQIGFTGGINIREGHCLALSPKHPVADLHFRVTGPVVTQFQEVFADDWAFTTGEILQGATWFSESTPHGDVLARGCPDGPDEHLQTFQLTLLGALSCAHSTIRIVTPYFLPDAALITALNVAALRGVQVDIVLPEQSNIKLVQWASTALLWQLLERGCRIWFSPPPFDHTKLFLIDNMAVFVGSANWDPRSLRLNFEFNLECYSSELARELTALADAKISASRAVNLNELDSRSLWIRLRDGTARLCSPFL